MSATNITNHLTAVKSLLIIYNCDASAFRDHRILLFINSVKINRLLNPVFKTVIYEHILWSIVLYCDNFQFQFIFKALYLFVYFLFAFFVSLGCEIFFHTLSAFCCPFCCIVIIFSISLFLKLYIYLLFYLLCFCLLRLSNILPHAISTFEQLPKMSRSTFDASRHFW